MATGSVKGNSRHLLGCAERRLDQRDPEEERRKCGWNRWCLVSVAEVNSRTLVLGLLVFPSSTTSTGILAFSSFPTTSSPGVG